MGLLEVPLKLRGASAPRQRPYQRLRSHGLQVDNRYTKLSSGIDLSGDGTSEHLVLGIGRDRAGNRKMFYDPQARQMKEGWGDYMDPSDEADADKPDPEGMRSNLRGSVLFDGRASQ